MSFLESVARERREQARTVTRGLRERKRLETRRRIQLAVLDLVDELGLDATTIDKVSERADISPRTFFNYFATKEEAVLGDAPELPDSGLIEAFVNAGPDSPLFDDLTLVLLGAGRKTMENVELMQRQHRILKRHPHLLAARMATMRVFEEQIAEIVSRRLEADGTPPDRVAVRAPLVTLVAFAAMRHAWVGWVNGRPDGDLAEQLRTSFRELQAVFAAEADAKTR